MNDLAALEQAVTTPVYLADITVPQFATVQPISSTTKYLVLYGALGLFGVSLMIWLYSRRNA